MRKAAELGVAWVEFDVKLSRDGVPVLMHDDSLDRTTNGRGAVAARTASELATLDAGAWFGPAFRGEPIPTLEATLRLLAELELGAIIEIKPCPGRELETGRVVAARAAGAACGVWLSSFSEVALRAAVRAVPELPRAMLVEAVPADWRARLQALGAVALHAAARHLDRKTVLAVLRSGVDLCTYTVNDTERGAELRELGVTAVFSDVPDRLLAVWR
jgi:glycerophosphoryl diester phosphodiesterase